MSVRIVINAAISLLCLFVIIFPEKYIAFLTKRKVIHQSQLATAYKYVISFAIVGLIISLLRLYFAL